MAVGVIMLGLTLCGTAIPGIVVGIILIIGAVGVLVGY